jgi:hypothetical protein
MACNPWHHWATGTASEPFSPLPCGGPAGLEMVACTGINLRLNLLPAVVIDCESFVEDTDSLLLQLLSPQDSLVHECNLLPSIRLDVQSGLLGSM